MMDRPALLEPAAARLLAKIVEMQINERRRRFVTSSRPTEAADDAVVGPYGIRSRKHPLNPRPRISLCPVGGVTGKHGVQVGSVSTENGLPCD